MRYHYAVEFYIHNKIPPTCVKIETNTLLTTGQIRKKLSAMGYKKVNLSWISGLKD